MTVHNRLERAAAAILAVPGAVTLGIGVMTLVRVLPDFGSPDPHASGEALVSLVLGVAPFSIAGLATFTCAWALWAGWPVARTLGWAWTGLAALNTVVFALMSHNTVWAVLAVVFGSGSEPVYWPDPLQEPLFWIPGLVAVAGVAVFSLLTAERFQHRPAARTPLPAAR